VAVTGDQVFFTAVNSKGTTWNIQPSNRSIDNSALGSVSLVNGTILWETPSPGGSVSLVAPSVANVVAFFGVTELSVTNAPTGIHGSLLMLTTLSGDIIRSVALDANFHGGIAIQDQYIMFGSGMY